MPWLKLLELIRTRASGENAMRAAAAYREYPLKLSFSSYGQGIEWLSEWYKEHGLQSEVIRFPADGKTIFADRHFPLAWDVEEGWLKVADAAFPDKLLADYRSDPYGIVPFSADSGGEQEGVIIPAVVLREKGARGKFHDVVILFDRYPTQGDLLWALDAGCKASVACAGIDPGNPVKFEARRWFNDHFGEGQIDLRSRTLPAYSVPPRCVVALQAHYAKHGPVPVKYLMKSRTYAGSAPAATALIVGAREPQREVFLTAHAYEPNASNNVAGVAICLEAARVLAELIRSGQLPPPRRSIRFFHGLEMFGLYAYAMRNRDSFGKAIGGMTLDCLGYADQRGVVEKMELLRIPFLNPSFVHALSEEVLRDSARKLGLEFCAREGFTSNDDIVQDPLFGPGWAFVNGTAWQKAGFYHTNADTVDKLSPERMAEFAAGAATVAYLAASAGPDEAKALSRMSFNRAAKQISSTCHLALAGLSTDPDATRARGLKLHAFRSVAIPAAIAEIESSAQLLPEGDQESFKKGLAGLTAGFRAFAEGEIGSALLAMATTVGDVPARFTRRRLAGIELEAASMTPTRKIPGCLGLGTLPAEARKEAEALTGCYRAEEYWSFFAPEGYWFDGKRSLLDAALAAYGTAGWDRPEAPAQRNAAIERYMTFARFLEKHGCLDIARKPVSRPVSKEAIIAGVRSIGIKAGDLVMVHSSLSQFGEVAGGPDAVIDALVEVVTPEGVLAMPAFTNTAVGEADPPFDPASSVAYTGSISNTFWRRPGVLRHGQYTHSIAARGTRAAEFLQSEDLSDTFDRRGPWGRLLDWNGKLLCFGETMGANTYLHALEAWLLSYLDRAFARVSDGGKEKEVFIKNYPNGCRGGWYSKRREAEYFKRLNARGVYRETKIGEAAALVVNVRDFTREMHQLFKEDPAILLHKSGCLPCAERRARLAGWTVPEKLPDAGRPGT